MFKPHYPPHYYTDNKIYFITARTVDKKRILDTEEKKAILNKAMIEAGNKFNIGFYAWIILDNHYHILINILKGDSISAFMKLINGKSAFLLNGIEKARKRKIWFNYWDTCIRSEKDFWMRFNYIHHNAIKHNYVKKMSDYSFSSYDQWVVKKGIEWMSDAFEKYPIVDFTIEDDSALHSKE